MMEHDPRYDVDAIYRNETVRYRNADRSMVDGLMRRLIEAPDFLLHLEIRAASKTIPARARSEQPEGPALAEPELDPHAECCDSYDSADTTGESYECNCRKEAAPRVCHPELPADHKCMANLYGQANQVAALVAPAGLSADSYL